MKAELIRLPGFEATVVVKSFDYTANCVVNFSGQYTTALSEAFVKMVNETMCPECGRFSGTHGSYFMKTGQDGFGSVEGRTVNCSRENSGRDR